MTNRKDRNSAMAAIDVELKEAYENERALVDTLQQYLQSAIDKLGNFSALVCDAADTVEYYFSIQHTYKKKEEFLCYLNKLLNIYVMYLEGTFDEDDEEIEDIIEFIEDNYDFLIYFGEDINPVYRRINSPDGCSVRKQLNWPAKKRLTGLLFTPQ